jgi:hypothetical protein
MAQIAGRRRRRSALGGCEVGAIRCRGFNRGVAQLGSALRSGRRGRGFESRHPDSHVKSKAEVRFTAGLACCLASFSQSSNPREILYCRHNQCHYLQHQDIHWEWGACHGGCEGIGCGHGICCRGRRIGFSCGGRSARRALYRNGDRRRFGARSAGKDDHLGFQFMRIGLHTRPLAGRNVRSAPAGQHVER